MNSPTASLAWLEQLSPQARVALLTDVTAQIAESRIEDYRPYARQREFHAAGRTFRERLLRAGNQNGKTFAAGAEWSYHATGEYPDWWQGRVFDRPGVYWASSETGESTRDNPQRSLLGQIGEIGTGAIPLRALGDYGMASGVSNLYDFIKVRHRSSGWSLLRFKYYAQGRKKWQGPPVHAVWFDEEPPEDIYDEGLARTIATGGMAALSFTPLLGMSSVVARFLMSSDKSSEARHDTNMTIEDAEHIPAEERARIIASFPAHQRSARAQGIPTLGSGLIFPVDEQRIKVEAFPIPAHWKRICGMDFGWDHPTAGAWLAHDCDTDTIYVYDAYRVNEQPVVIHAAALKARGAWIPTAWPHDGNNDTAAGPNLANQYRAQGVAMRSENAQFPETPGESDRPGSRISVEAGVQEMLTRMETGRWKVFAHLNDWFEEFRLYHRENGKIVKLRDDCLSASRYALMDLRFAVTKPAPVRGITMTGWRG